MSNPHIRSDDTFRLTESTNVTNLADEVFSENEEFSPACIDLDRVENFPGENEERSSMNCWLHAIEGIDKDGTKPSITASTASNSTFNLGKNHNRKSQLDHIGVAQSECESPFSSSQVEFILAEQAKVAHNDSSISLVDLDAMDDENFLNPSLVPAKLEVANLLGEATGTGLMFRSDLRASPIPLAPDMAAYVTNTPPQNRTPQVSSPFQSPVDANHRLFSISSTTASPIRPACIVSSTPFIGRHSSTSDGLLSQADAELPAFNFVNTPSCQPTPVKKPFNATFDVPPSNTALSAPATQNNPNLTFDVIVAQPLASDTFTASVPSVAAAINTTYNADATQSTVINNTFNAGLRQATAINPPKSNTNNQTFDIAKNNTTFNAEATKVLNTTVDIEPSKSTAVNTTFNAVLTSKPVNKTFNAEKTVSIAANSTFTKESPKSTAINTTFNLDTSKSTAVNTTFNLDTLKSTAVNTTFDRELQKSTLDNVTFNTSLQGNTNNATFSAEVKTNSTFNIDNQQMETSPINSETISVQINPNSTFNKSPSSEKDNGTCDVNDTYDVIMELQSPPSESGTADSSKESDTMNTSNSRRAISAPSKLRKPLSVVGNSSESGSTKSAIPMKKSSRLVAPRMNTAAMSRIQARSPQKTPLSNVDENTTLMRPPISTTSLRKPLTRKGITAPRKSLLPPSHMKSRISTPSATGLSQPAPRAGKLSPPKTVDKPTDAHGTQSNPSKRKAESPKHAGRTAKFEATRNDSSSSRSTTSALRNSGVVTSRIASLANRTGNKRPQASSIPATKSLSSTSLRSSSQSSINSSKTRTSLSKPAKAAKCAPVVTNGTTRHKPVNKTSQCAVAMATLLDHVVNKLDGLSAPQLAQDKQQLSQLVSEHSQTNTDLSSRVSELEASLLESRDAHYRDVTAMEQKHEADMTLVKNQLNDLTQRLEKEKEQQEHVITAMKESHSKAINAMENDHETAVADLHHQWAQEREEIEQETNELREKMDEKVQERVQELVQPYISAHEENKSLRSVLEMKNAEHHKLLLEMSQQSDLHAELRTYRDQIISLQQKNEDLRTQIQERNAEYRVVKSESDQLRQSCEDQQHSMRSQQQRIEELSYRLASPSTSPASPFNPVFTQSPTQSNDTSSPFGNGPFGRKTSERGHSSLASNEHRSPITTTPKCEGRT